MLYAFGILIAIILALGGVTKCQHEEIVTLKADKQAVAVESERLTKQREAENKKAIEGYIKYARESEADYEKRIAAYRAAAKSGSVFQPNEGSCPAGQGGEGSTGAPEKAPGREGTPATPRSVALGEPEVATVLGWYSHAESCSLWAWPTQK